ncbi:MULTISPECIES: hypothetical protein [Bacillaceae]|uniref:Uncharacterized protein n=1 Tax=Evansella alkalicola TaxID=745819 RepID=A0ABS6JY78_9BACI|nr:MULTISPECIES: hypothetical protein [Bacillaceae]MBU9723546.1 hypothetical protein [Bacillus alkalicola]
MDEKKLIENKRKFWIGVSILAAITIIVLPYPHDLALGETVLIALGIPPFSNMETYTGLHFVGISMFILLITGLTFIVQSINKWKGRIVILTLIFLPSIPTFIVETIQTTVASGVYAVSYDKDQSHCSFNTMEEFSFVEIECTIPLRNYQSEEVQLELVFLESRTSDIPTYSLLNTNGPYEMTLGPKTSQTLTIKERINLSDIEGDYSVSGSSSVVNIRLIDDEGRERRL